MTLHECREVQRDATAGKLGIQRNRYVLPVIPICDTCDSVIPHLLGTRFKVNQWELLPGACFGMGSVLNWWYLVNAWGYGIYAMQPKTI